MEYTDGLLRAERWATGSEVRWKPFMRGGSVDRIVMVRESRVGRRRGMGVRERIHEELNRVVTSGENTN